MIDPDKKKKDEEFNKAEDTDKVNETNKADARDQREMSAEHVPMLSTFIETRQYHRFVEVGSACRQNGFIAICYGEAGVGKTRSARRLTNWDQMERQLLGEAGGEGEVLDGKTALGASG